MRAGVGAGAIDRRIAGARLHPVHRGVYSVGHRLLSPEGRWLAAALACDSGLLSHLDAAALWALVVKPAGPVHVTVPTRAGRRNRPGIHVHRVSLPAGEITERRGVPVTTPARTLVDIAELLPSRKLQRALDEAEYLRLVEPRVLRSTLEANANRSGARKLRSVLAAHSPGSTRTRSELEELFLTLCRSQALPEPTVNARIDGREVDFVWFGARVIAETDGWAAHGTRAAFERDRLRDAGLHAAGYIVLRFTYRQVASRPEWVGGVLRRSLVQRDAISRA